MGKRHTKCHTLCRRCGRKSFHMQKKRCASCGYPDAKTRKCKNDASRVIFGINVVAYNLKVIRRRGQGSGRMRYMKTIIRSAKNGFREGTTPKPRVIAAKAN